MFLSANLQYSNFFLLKAQTVVFRENWLPPQLLTRAGRAVLNGGT